MELVDEACLDNVSAHLILNFCPTLGVSLSQDYSARKPSIWIRAEEPFVNPLRFHDSSVAVSEHDFVGVVVHSVARKV